MSKSLAIIVTGQLRTFFENDSFEKMILLSKANFTNLVIFAVLNSTDETEFVRLKAFFNKLPIAYFKIIDFTKYNTELESKIQDKIRNPEFHHNKAEYFSIPRDAHRGLSNPEMYKGQIFLRNDSISQKKMYFFRLEELIMGNLEHATLKLKCG
jgi:hypothetical protein